MFRPTLNNELAAILLTCALAAAGVIALLYAVPAADVDQCLTREQAKARYPKAWLYWHTERHCWDDQPGRFATRRGVYGKTNSLRLPAPHLDANGNVVRVGALSAEEIDSLQYQQEAERRLKTCCWPPVPVFTPWNDRIDGSADWTR